MKKVKLEWEGQLLLHCLIRRCYDMVYRVCYSEKLSAWLSSRGRTPSKYSHMMCFGHSHGGTTRTPVSHQQYRRKQSVINDICDRNVINYALERLLYKFKKVTWLPSTFAVWVDVCVCVPDPRFIQFALGQLLHCAHKRIVNRICTSKGTTCKLN